MTLSSTAVERAIAQCTSRWAMAKGYRLNTSIVLQPVHGLSGLFQAVSAVEPFTLSSPSHSVPIPNKPSRFRVRKATTKQEKQVSYCTCKPKTFYTEDTKVQGYLLASDIKIYTGIYLGDVPFRQSVNFK